MAQRRQDEHGADDVVPGVGQAAADPIRRWRGTMEGRGDAAAEAPNAQGEEHRVNTVEQDRDVLE